MILNLDYNELAKQNARRQVKLGQHSDELMRNEALMSFTSKRFEEIFTAFMKCDPADGSRLQLLCLQAREMNSMIHELEVNIEMGKVSATALAEKQATEGGDNG